MFLHGKDDAIGNDGQEDGVLKGRPLNEEHCEPGDNDENVDCGDDYDHHTAAGADDDWW